MSAPTIPSRIVTRQPPGSRPGMRNLAMAPTINPMMSVLINPVISQWVRECIVSAGGNGCVMADGKRNSIRSREGGVEFGHVRIDRHCLFVPRPRLTARAGTFVLLADAKCWPGIETENVLFKTIGADVCGRRRPVAPEQRFVVGHDLSDVRFVRFRFDQGYQSAWARPIIAVEAVVVVETSGNADRGGSGSLRPAT